MLHNSLVRRRNSRLLPVALLAAAGSTTACTVGTQTFVDPAVAHACNVTMGFSRSTIEYRDCVDSVGATNEAVAEQADTERDWAACAQQGLHAGTPAYAMCVLQRQQTRPAQ